MKWIFRLKTVAMILVLSACHNTGFLQVVKDSNSTQSIATPKPGPPPLHGSKTYDLISDVVGETTSPVDILWVIDNSNSMADKQYAVSSNAAVFMDTFTKSAKVKWKMGLLSTTPSDNPYVGFTPTTQLNNTTLNPVRVFQDAVDSLGVYGADNEESFGPILKYLRKYPGFLTPDAYLALIFVTDEEELTWETNWDLLPVDKFIEQSTALKGGDRSKILTYGVFASKENCYNGNFWYRGSRWNDYMYKTAGKLYSTCDPDFGKVLAGLGDDLVKSITAPHPTILIDVEAIPSSIKVFYAGRQLKPGFKNEGGEWIYDSKYHVIEITDRSILTNAYKTITVTFDYYPR
ncbi:MAG: hypothetical protein ABL958_09070 [Bdellovibrionia bacterium]